VATIGPASRDEAMLRSLIEAGADVFRLNFSHGSHADHAAAYAAIRAAEAALERPIAVIADLQGPKLRLGTFVDGQADLKTGQSFRLELSGPPGNSARAVLPHPEIFAAIGVGARLLIDDGRVSLKVDAHGSDWADCTVIEGGPISNRKGVNAPDVTLNLSPLTAKDRADLTFALELGVDYVALSFVQRAEDMAELRAIVRGQAGVLAKIEKPAALINLEAILDLCDAVMVARGDLGVELAPEKVPSAQKTIIRAARARGVPVIVATQMLDSMVASPTPTRAEASDCAHAVYEGVDALMLSAESAAGKFPREAVAMMARIIERTESDPAWPELMAAEARQGEQSAEPIALAARVAADAGRAACLVSFTTTGTSARKMVRERPTQPVMALTPRIETGRRLALVWGLETEVTQEIHSFEEMTDLAVRAVVDVGLAKAGDRIVIVAGAPFGAPGATNLIRMAYVPRART
jgi:pyruvate kinase